MSKETKWRYEMVEKVEVRRCLAKAMLPLEELNFGITVVLCASGGECVVSIKVAQK